MYPRCSSRFHSKHTVDDTSAALARRCSQPCRRLLVGFGCRRYGLHHSKKGSKSSSSLGRWVARDADTNRQVIQHHAFGADYSFPKFHLSVCMGWVVSFSIMHLADRMRANTFPRCVLYVCACKKTPVVPPGRGTVTPEEGLLFLGESVGGSCLRKSRKTHLFVHETGETQQVPSCGRGIGPKK